MDVVGARLGDDIDDAPGRVAVGGAHIVGIDVEFLHRVGVGEGQVGIDVTIVEVHAIHQVRDTVGSATVHLGILLGGVTCPPSQLPPQFCAGYIGCAGNKEHQLLHFPAIQRQRDDVLLIDQLADGGGVGSDQ